MLVQLHIENYALIDHVVVEFGPGLNVLTGETGTGKSLIIGALGLVLGQRAQTDVMRTPEKASLIEALFDLTPYPALQEECRELGIDLNDAQLLLKRVITKSGSRCYVNANLATLTMLHTIGQRLVDILGQHQHHTLLQPDHQRALLDAFGKLSHDVEALRCAYHRYHDLEREYRQLQQTEQERLQRQDLLQFQLNEIDQAALQPEEEEHLERERHLLVNAEKLYDLSQAAYDALYRDETSATDMLALALEKLTQLTALDPEQETVRNELQESLYVVEEVAQNLREYSNRMDVDPSRLQVIEDRLASLARLKRKYGPTVAEILQHRDIIAEELQSWDQHEARLEALEGELTKLRQTLKSLAVTLSDKRQQTAARLEHAVQQELHDLNMGTPQFRILCTLRHDPQGDVTVGTERVGLTPEGIDDVTYLFSSNPGQEPKPLARIASGGELSRVMLALKSVLAREDHVPTLIFDEVDAGIGGKTAKIVGEKLRRIAQGHQVFCITHLPQIASHGDQHFRVAKLVEANETTTALRWLTFGERIDEIARMSGGKEITETTRKHAEEMLTQHP